MARIRTIKPEFPHSESMGRVSRDARLLFILLWTLADDSGRMRGSSRILASLLFPYDDDANEKIDGWLDELEAESSIVRYMVETHTYCEILNWQSHQKIDHPSKSKWPNFDQSSRDALEASRGLPKSSARIKDQGSRTKDQGPKDQRTSVRRLGKTTIEPEWFADFKNRYPERSGGMNWRAAIRAASARIADGHTPAEFLEGADRYRAFAKASGNFGTVYVKQPATFLGPDKHFLEPWRPPATKADVRLSQNLTAADEFMARTDAMQ